ncbi:uncharacterized protein [Zea mays]|uniref:UBC core domain-containing protein n=1 Tax=Zea mays TaxID=4577 RepID=A0A804MXI7_MAIZE|nr:uncharacterized protein LOC100502472 isoform X1 [Zea mays]|eukprot:XP_020405594.2 uncharacterized protein LOC100502472 isoform X1 [Zea mays]
MIVMMILMATTKMIMTSMKLTLTSTLLINLMIWIFLQAWRPPYLGCRKLHPRKMSKSHLNQILQMRMQINIRSSSSLILFRISLTITTLRILMESQTEPGQREFNMTGNFWRRIYQGHVYCCKKVQIILNGLDSVSLAYIFVRVAEDRMDLLRAAIIGPKGTPYHDGLFFFDIHIPSAYPCAPPLVYYHSGGLRINPNLYNNGKVCLSLLGTWDGRGCEKWNPAQSTMLQVLVSIQALILNDKPYYNEPGYESYANTPNGERLALDYNDNTFLHSCKTMLYSLRRPPEHFADLVAGHFRVHGHTILAACKHYMAGNDIGSVVPEEEEEEEEEESSEHKSGDAGASGSAPELGVIKAIPTKRRSSFNPSLKVLYEDLLMEFNVKGADTRKFIDEKLKKNKPAAA